VWHILGLSFVAGFAQAFGGPAYQALVPSLVERHDMPNAIALNSIQFNLARVIGPVLGGLALTQLGAEWCFGLNGVSFLAPVISLLLIRARFLPERTVDSVLASMKQGIGFIRGREAMTGLIALAFCMTALGIPIMTFLPVFAKDVFHRGPETFTLFLVCSGLGSITGALAVAGLSNIQHRGRMALLLLVCLGVIVSGFALSHSVALSCALLFLSGAALIGTFATISSLVQLITTDDMRGRVMSVYNVAFRGGMPFGSLVVGWLVPRYTAPVVLACDGVLLAVVALYFLLVQRRVAAL
jgi:predicted MFS family arabinose efflux permease